MVALSPKFIMIRIPERKRSGLATDEWIVAEHIYYLRAQNENGGTGIGVLEAIAFDHGWGRKKVQRIISTLLDSGFIRKLSRYEYKMTKKWTDLVEGNYLNENISLDVSFNDFYDLIKKEYPRKDFGTSDRKLVIAKNLADNKINFIAAISNFKQTRDANNSFCMSFASFVDKWESYIDGVPSGVTLLDGTVSNGQKIANAVVVSDPAFEAFFNRCYTFAVDMEEMPYPQKEPIYESSIYWRNGEVWFSAEDTVIIKSFGGLKKISLEGFNSDFKSKMAAEWNLHNGGVL